MTENEVVIPAISTKVEVEQRLPWQTRYAPAGWVIAGLITAAGFLLVGSVGGDQTDSANARTVTVQQQALRVANPVDELCAEGGALATQLNRRGACSPARSIVQAPPTAVAGRGPTDAEVEAGVADYLQRNPPPAGRAPTTEEITAAVATYLLAHPPTPGRAPTSAEIADAVQTYLVANPPAPGKDGAPASDEQVAAAVAAYLQAHPPAAGADGANGAAGENGKPPASWSWTGSSGTRHVCTRSNDDDSSPTYTCTSEPPPDETSGLPLPTG